MNKRLLYILGIAAAMLTSCSDEVADAPSPFLNGTEKTPLVATALLGVESAPQTRAADKAFAENDKLIAYLRHVTWNGETTGERTLVSAQKSPSLITFTKGSTTMTAYSGSDIIPIGTNTGLGLSEGNTNVASDLSVDGGLYWDDFSVNDPSKDKTDYSTYLRDPGHYLQSYYGYCYNGGTPNSGTELDTEDKKAAGTIGWTVQADQTAGIKTSDLLWSAEQTPVAYSHALDGRKGLIIPFTHAMSKVTIEIALDEGFDVDNEGKAVAFGSNATTPTLYANRVTNTTAPTYTHSTTVAEGDAAKIQMHLADDEQTTKKVRVYEAIIAPTVMKADNLLAQITVDGNKYDIKLSDAVLTTDPAGGTAAWSSKLKAYTISSSTLTKNSPEADYTTEKGGITLAGVNYRIKVTLKKQKIEVKAYITDWTDVKATADGVIMFDADVKASSDVTGTEVTSTSFDLWRSTTNVDAASYDADGSAEGIQKASTYTCSTDKWAGSPTLYWANASTSYYFRALAKVENPATAPNVITTVSGSTAATQGTDLLWAQTSKHKGKDASGNVIQENGVEKVYDAGSAINPRTGDVPLTFEHAMSKVSVILKHADGIEDAAKVNLAGAKISIINLYNGGTINIKTGDIEKLTSPIDADPQDDPFTIKDQPVDGEYKWLNQFVIPQSLVNDKGGNARETSPAFYQSSELTKIYSDGTSLASGGGDGTYYLTSDLNSVAATLYDETTANTYNAYLTGARSEGYEEKYTAEEALAYNAALDGAVKEGDAKPSPGNYDAEEAKAHNATLPGAVKAGDSKPEEGTYTAEEAATYNAALTGAVKAGDAKPSPGNYSADEAATYNAELTGAVSTETTKKTYTADDANAYNATLDGAVAVGDVQIPAHYALPGSKTPTNTDKVSHNPGDLKSAGSKIMMYITLEDKTRYSIDLATCKAYTEDSEGKKTELDAITEWKRGEHYTYTISLAKEAVTFRAMIKDWVENTAGGNANLEWD